MTDRRVQLDTNWHYHGFRALVIENSCLRLVILPELGAKLWSLVYKPVDREIFWHNPRLGPRPAHYGAAYDDWFCGGWDELFPNDAPTTFAGDLYPDHGEWWAMPFEWEVTTRRPDEITLHFWRAGVVTNTFVERWLTLRSGDPTIAIRCRSIFSGSCTRPWQFRRTPASTCRSALCGRKQPSTTGWTKSPSPGLQRAARRGRRWICVWRRGRTLPPVTFTTPPSWPAVGVR
jgi:hypothetical protein